MKKHKAFTKKQLEKALKELPHWKTNPKGTMLVRTCAFDDHIAALAFVARVTVYAQVLNHHPDLLFTYQKVKVTLTTHDAKGITQSDIEMAMNIDTLCGG